MNSLFNFKQILVFSIISLVQGSSGSVPSSPGNGASMSSGSSLQVSPNNTILQNLYALSYNQSLSQNSSLSYVSLLLGLNTSCTANVTEMLNSTSGNYTFFAPSDGAFRRIPGFPDFGPDFCSNCGGGSGNSSSNSSGGGLISRIFQTTGSNASNASSGCSKGCNDSSLSFNASSPQLMPCLPQILQYHLLNSSLYFNSTTFGFLNRSSFNLTVMPTMLNSSCLVNLVNSTTGMTNATNETAGSVGTLLQTESGSSNNNSMQQNNQVLVFNISSSSGNGSATSTGSPSEFNVTILHGINAPANVTIVDIPSSNGVLHVIDALLIPPANMTDTINSTYSSSSSSNSSNSSSSSSSVLPSFLNQTELEQYSNMSGITVFLPDMNSTSSFNNTNSNSNSNFNLTNYIFPTLLYNNRSFEVIGNLSDGVFFQQNLTNLNGENVTILFGRNNAMLFNGSRVTQSDVLMKNGVLHLFDASTSIFGEGQGQGNGNGNEPSSGNNTAAASLGRILRQLI